MVKFGITERGDIAFSDEYIDKIDKGVVEAAILISKGLPTTKGREFMIDNSRKLIFHATTTGLGGTRYEPNVVNLSDRLDGLTDFIAEGFPQSHIVIRVDPIITTPDGFDVARTVIRLAYDLGFRRFRYSFIDLYKHVVQRLKKEGLEVPPKISQVSRTLLSDFVDGFIGMYEARGCIFEACGEYTRHQVGCISGRDYILCGIDPSKIEQPTWKQRECCLCCAGKVELLSNKSRCPHQCIYCYWKD